MPQLAHRTVVILTDVIRDFNISDEIKEFKRNDVIKNLTIKDVIKDFQTDDFILNNQSELSSLISNFNNKAPLEPAAYWNHSKLDQGFSTLEAWMPTI